MMEASERSIAYHRGFQVVIDFQAPTAYRYLATFSSTFAIAIAPFHDV